MRIERLNQVCEARPPRRAATPPHSVSASPPLRPSTVTLSSPPPPTVHPDVISGDSPPKQGAGSRASSAHKDHNKLSLFTPREEEGRSVTVASTTLVRQQSTGNLGGGGGGGGGIALGHERHQPPTTEPPRKVEKEAIAIACDRLQASGASVSILVASASAGAVAADGRGSPPPTSSACRSDAWDQPVRLSSTKLATALGLDDDELADEMVDGPPSERPTPAHSHNAMHASSLHPPFCTCIALHRAQRFVTVHSLSPALLYMYALFHSLSIRMHAFHALIGGTFFDIHSMHRSQFGPCVVSICWQVSDRARALEESWPARARAAGPLCYRNRPRRQVQTRYLTRVLAPSGQLTRRPGARGAMAVASPPGPRVAPAPVSTRVPAEARPAKAQP